MIYFTFRGQITGLQAGDVIAYGDNGQVQYLSVLRNGVNVLFNGDDKYIVSPIGSRPEFANLALFLAGSHGHGVRVYSGALPTHVLYAAELT